VRTKLGVLTVILGLAILSSSWWVIDSGRVKIGDTPAPSSSTAAGPTVSLDLPACPNASVRPRVPVAAEWEQVITEYYAAKGLAVVSVASQAQLLNVDEQRVGQYRCVGPNGALGAYAGSVPIGAIAAVTIMVENDSPDVWRSPATFTLASRGDGWSVAAEAYGIAPSLAFPE